MAGPLQRVFSAERQGRARLSEAEELARKMELQARAKADELVSQAEVASKGLLAEAADEAKEKALERKVELERELAARADAWRARYESLRGQIVKRIVATVLAEDAEGD